MKKITYTSLDGQLIASGELGKNVSQLEGNYYFDKSAVNLELLKRKDKAYFCPIKSSSCDYFYLAGSDQDQSREIAWVYETISNSLFTQVAGKIGFYARSSNSLELKID